MFANEGQHSAAHFHARYAEHSASVALDRSVIAGSLPAPQLRLVQEWAAAHEADLAANWERLRRREKVEPIQPLA